MKATHRCQGVSSKVYSQYFLHGFRLVIFPNRIIQQHVDNLLSSVESKDLVQTLVETQRGKRTSSPILVASAGKSVAAQWTILVIKDVYQSERCARSIGQNSCQVGSSMFQRHLVMLALCMTESACRKAHEARATKRAMC